METALLPVHTPGDYNTRHPALDLSFFESRMKDLVNGVSTNTLGPFVIE